MVSVKAGDFTITLNAEENTGAARTAKVSLLRAGTTTELTSFEVVQEGVAEVKALAELVWSMQTKDNVAWYNGLGLSSGSDRNITMDDEYIYIAQSGATSGIKAISIKDNTVVKDVQFTAFSSSATTAGTYPISCVRMLPNTDASVNEGKPVLVACNLSFPYASWAPTNDGSQLIVYVWKNGIDAEPDHYVIGTGNLRVGDKFTVSGTYQSGELWFRDWCAADASVNVGDRVIRVAVNDGVIGSYADNVKSYAHGRFNISVDLGSTTIGQAYVYPTVSTDGSGNPASLLCVTTNSATFMTGSGNAYTASEWTTDPKLAMTYGYNFIEHNGKKYIAYARVDKDTTNGRLQIIEDINGTAEGFKETLEAQTNLFELPICDSPSSITATYSLGDCIARNIDGKNYIAVLIQGCGLALYEMQ